MAENIVTAQDFSLSTLVTGVKKYFKKSIILTAVNLLIVGILIFNLSISLVSENQFIFYLSFVWIYLLALWGLQVQYNFPLLIKQDSQIFSIFKNSFFISLHNFVPSLIITIVNAILINVGVFLVVPMVFFFMAVVAVIQNMMLKEIFDIYDGLK